jgi:hypothetical protein
MALLLWKDLINQIILSKLQEEVLGSHLTKLVDLLIPSMVIVSWNGATKPPRSTLANKIPHILSVYSAFANTYSLHSSSIAVMNQLDALLELSLPNDRVLPNP